VNDEIDRLVVVLLDQVGKTLHRHGVGMLVVELRSAVERDGLCLSATNNAKG